MPNRLDKSFVVGDKVIVTQAHYHDLPVGTTGVITRIPTERYHSNEVVVKWDTSGEYAILACWALDKVVGVTNA